MSKRPTRQEASARGATAPQGGASTELVETGGARPAPEGALGPAPAEGLGSASLSRGDGRPAGGRQADASGESPQKPTEGSADSEKTPAPGGRVFKANVTDLKPEVQKLISKLLTEGSTFEDVVETINGQGGDGVTLNAVQNHFQGDPELQAKRVHHLINSAEALLATVGKNPKSAEARLARATFLTGYLRVRRDASLITPKEAEHNRLERENLSLKRKVLVMQKDKAVQELKYSNARTRMILLSQEKLKEEILKLQQEAKGRRAGEPLGPEMLERIQQLYGLACQPLLCEENPHASTQA
jgi:hypothetical protein